MINQANKRVIEDIELELMVDGMEKCFDKIFGLVTNGHQEELGMVAERIQVKELMRYVGLFDEDARKDLIETMFILVNNAHSDLVYFKEAYIKDD